MDFDKLKPKIADIVVVKNAGRDNVLQRICKFLEKEVPIITG